MKRNNNTRKESVTIKDLYPHMTEEQLKEAEENLDRYLTHVLRICERLHQEAKDKRKSVLDHYKKKT
jgi:hypothetical protein